MITRRKRTKNPSILTPGEMGFETAAFAYVKNYLSDLSKTHPRPPHHFARRRHRPLLPPAVIAMATAAPAAATNTAVAATEPALRIDADLPCVLLRRPRVLVPDPALPRSNWRSRSCSRSRSRSRSRCSDSVQRLSVLSLRPHLSLSCGAKRPVTSASCQPPSVVAGTRTAAAAAVKRTACWPLGDAYDGEASGGGGRDAVAARLRG